MCIGVQLYIGGLAPSDDKSSGAKLMIREMPETKLDWTALDREVLLEDGLQANEQTLAQKLE